MATPSTQPTTRSAVLTAGVAVAAFAVSAALALPAAADNPGHGRGQGNGQGQTHQGSGNGSGHNPPGNNGTVFIHDVARDHHPHNVPHVGCTFYVDFFGFDNGQSVTVSFMGQAPTGKGTPLTGGWSSVISTTDAGGAGHDWDYEQQVTLDTGPLGPPAHQGFHVKMDVQTYEPGGHKYKVFWVQPCQSAAASAPGSTGAPTTTTAGATTGASSPSGSALGTTTTQSTGSTAAGQSSGGAVTPLSVSRSAGQPTQVLGEHFTRSAATPAAAASPGSLPFTGAEIAGLVLAAAAALGGGVLLMIAGRRRRRAGPALH